MGVMGEVWVWTFGHFFACQKFLTGLKLYASVCMMHDGYWHVLRGVFGVCEYQNFISWICVDGYLLLKDTCKHTHACM